MIFARSWLWCFLVAFCGEAYRAINLEVIVFLFSMFAFVTAFDVSGVLEDVAAKLFLKARRPKDIIYLG